MAMKGQKDVWHPQRGDVTRGHNVEQDVKVTFEARLWGRRNPKLDVMMIVEFQILLLTLFFNVDINPVPNINKVIVQASEYLQ